MKFRIFYSYDEGDFFDVEGETIEEIRIKAKEGVQSRGWDIDLCWSEKLEDKKG